MVDEQIRRAISLARSGDKPQARRLLLKIVQDDPGMETAWIWLVDTLSTDAERIAALKQCLRHIPESQKAQKALDIFQERRDSMRRDSIEDFAKDIKPPVVPGAVPSGDLIGDSGPPVSEDKPDPDAGLSGEMDQESDAGIMPPDPVRVGDSGQQPLLWEEPVESEPLPWDGPEEDSGLESGGSEPTEKFVYPWEAQDEEEAGAEEALFPWETAGEAEGDSEEDAAAGAFPWESDAEFEPGTEREGETVDASTPSMPDDIFQPQPIDDLDDFLAEISMDSPDDDGMKELQDAVEGDLLEAVEKSEEEDGDGNEGNKNDVGENEDVEDSDGDGEDDEDHQAKTEDDRR